MTQESSLSYWLAAVLLPDIGPRNIMRWVNSFSSIENLFMASEEEWREAGIPEKHVASLRKPDWASVEKELAWVNGVDQYIVSISDSNYPRLLKEISDPPLVLYVRGNKSILNEKQIAMVGARHATPAGLQDAEQFAFYLAEAGLVITSGLALGIDGASHKGALSAKGKTIAVMGTGLNHIYPAAHKGLAGQIIEQGGALVSEFPLNVSPQAHNFPRRNRIISGMSLGVLLVEAAIKSGSLITTRHAMEQNREVFAIPGSIHNPLSRGCHHLIRQGAKLVETASDVLEELQLTSSQMFFPNIAVDPEDQRLFPAYSTGLEAGESRSCFPDRLAQGRASRSQELFCLESKNRAPQPTQMRGMKEPSKQSIPSSITDELRQLLDQIDYATTPFDVIVLRSGLTIGEVSSMLLTLTFDGYVQTVAGGYMRMASVN